jgi:poly-gamma-glutamate synthesis protein (capsule biosynthesis protein)
MVFGAAVVALAGVAVFLAISADDKLGPGAFTQRAITASPSAGSPPSSPTPRPSPSPVIRRGHLLIHGTGDVSLDPQYISTFSTYGYGYAWSGLGGLFQRDDLTVINLECAVSNLGSPVPKEFNFSCDPAALPAARAAGVEVANLGNNHAYDYGPEAIVDSRRNLVRAGIAPVGAGGSPAEATKPAVFRIKGWRIAVVGIDEVVDPYPEAIAAPGHPGTACGHDVGCMVRAIRAADRKADLVIVVIHWGVELDTQPRDYQVEQAHQFINAGADIIFGSHSHRLEPMETYRGRPIFWGLGNFVWPHLSEEGSTTAVAEVRVGPKGALHGRLIPAYIASSGHPELRG